MKSKLYNFPTTDQYLQEQQIVLFRPIDPQHRENTTGHRRKWRMARICKLHKSKNDGRIRSVDIEIFDSRLNKLKILEGQSIHHIVPFENDLIEAIQNQRNESAKRKKSGPKPK